LFTKPVAPPENVPFTLDHIAPVAFATVPFNVTIELFAQTSGTELIFTIGAGGETYQHVIRL